MFKDPDPKSSEWVTRSVRGYSDPDPHLPTVCHPHQQPWWKLPVYTCTICSRLAAILKEQLLGPQFTYFKQYNIEASLTVGWSQPWVFLTNVLGLEQLSYRNKSKSSATAITTFHNFAQQSEMELSRLKALSRHAEWKKSYLTSKLSVKWHTMLSLIALPWKNKSCNHKTLLCEPFLFTRTICSSQEMSCPAQQNFSNWARYSCRMQSTWLAGFMVEEKRKMCMHSEHN